jgi:hypothetical protein
MENGRQKASVAVMAFQQDIATPLKQPPDRFITIPFFFCPVDSHSPPPSSVISSLLSDAQSVGV